MQDDVRLDQEYIAEMDEVLGSLDHAGGMGDDIHVAPDVDPGLEQLLGGEVHEEFVEPEPAAPRVRADASDRFYFDLPTGGRIVYYITRQEFYAECGLRGAGHDKLCRRCRTSRAPAGNWRNSAQGRPLGMLVLWLQSAGFFDSSDNHKLLFSCTFEQRKAARQHLKELPGSSVLFEFERPKLPEEDSEPEQDP